MKNIILSLSVYPHRKCNARNRTDTCGWNVIAFGVRHYFRFATDEQSAVAMFCDLSLPFLPQVQITFSEAKAILADLGFTLSKREGEYRLNIANGKEETAYYTDCLEDAIGSAKLIGEMNVGTAKTGNDLTAENIAKLTPTEETEFTPEEIKLAREFWADLSDADLLLFWRHYTTGKGAGIYASVSEETSYLDYLVCSFRESASERASNC